MIPLNLLGYSSRDEAAPLSIQDSINYFPEISGPGERAVITLKGCHGMTQFADVGAGPHRGSLQVEVGGYCYAVSGQTLYRVNSAGTGTALGTIPGSERVSMSYLSTGTDYHIIVVNGTGGYVWKTADSTFVEVTDSAFPGSLQADFTDQYIVGVEPNGTYWFHSDIVDGAGDATAYTSLDRYESQGSPDPLVGIVVSQREVIVFNRDTAEIFINTGAETATFERYSGTFIQRGCASRWTLARLDNSVFWMGDDGIVYRLNGHTPQRVSTHAVEQDLAAADRSDFFAFSWEDKGHAFYVITNPDGKTWVYDCASQMWHRRVSYGLNRWRANTYCFAFGKHLVGDYSTGKIWELSRSVYADGSDPLVAERYTQYVHDNNGILFMPLLELVFDTGNGLLSGQGSAPLVELRYSDNSGRDWSNWKQASLGAMGEYGTRVQYRNLGRIRRQLAFHFRVSDPVRRDAIAANAIIEGGTE